jgi:hypothetical protein
MAISAPLIAVITVAPPWYWSRTMPPPTSSMSNGSRPTTRAATHSLRRTSTARSCHSSDASPMPVSPVSVTSRTNR